PAPAEPEAPVARPVDEVIPEQGPDVAEHLGIARRVQAVTAVVHCLPGQLEAPRVAADGPASLDHRHADAAAPREPVGPAEAGGAGAQDDHVGRRRGAHTTNGMKRLVRAQYAR